VTGETGSGRDASGELETIEALRQGDEEGGSAGAGTWASAGTGGAVNGGALIGYVLIRLDLALTGTKGRGGRRAEEAGPHRPEPSRFAAL
jgi:hypothetical protein